MAGSGGRYVKSKNSNLFFSDDDCYDFDDEMLNVCLLFLTLRLNLESLILLSYLLSEEEAKD